MVNDKQTRKKTKEEISELQSLPSGQGEKEKTIQEFWNDFGLKQRSLMREGEAMLKEILRQTKW